MTMNGDARRHPVERDAAGTAEEAPVVRVLALLDASRHSLAALTAAVDLAVSRHADLVALFVEDQDLLGSTGFPFAREIGACSGQARRLSRSDLEASLAHQARRVTEALEAAVIGREVHHELRVSRGRVVSEALSLAGPGDLLVLGKAGLSGHWGARLGSTSRALIVEAPCTVIIWDERLPLARGPLRVLDAPEQAGDDRLSIPEALSTLFDTVEVLNTQDARELERRLARADKGGLLLHRPQLARLLGQDAELLTRLPLPVIVVP
ncbi:universal stress protein [Halomonas cerina]|uniref:Nucleotide-binding universal stress UspA family protein n=1 Tax=Halomonas cerina TaxID=447424 RepID=A0A839UZP6_9GAMM|nr:universal stress protein [Halomonas cerina]MBB3188993.1 nucleotide-binding universal stress UspA family protein [Halomonas cerina]